MRRAGWIAVFLCLSGVVVGAEEPKERRPPSVLCKRVGVDKRHPAVHCTVSETDPYIPEWRLFGENEDELMDFSTGTTFDFEAPRQWRCLELRVDDAVHTVRLRAWVRYSAGQVEFRKWGDEGR